MNPVGCLLQNRGRAVDIAIDLARRASKIYKALPEVVQANSIVSYDLPEYVPPRGMKMCSREAALYYTFSVAVDYMTWAEPL